ncbi:MAG TPA: PQQ-binding-like beta-propeller repeat protein, partial [Polyangia bacterium]|nr:PQQ-binding-like beta-propeller repeat protein [Polyangia bacterium]
NAGGGGAAGGANGGGGGTAGGGGSTAGGGGSTSTDMDGTTGDDMTATAGGPYDWLQFGGSPQHASANTLETTLTAANVGTLKQLFQTTVPSYVDGAPVVAHGVTVKGATHDAVFVTTRPGDIVALDGHSGTILWQQAHGNASCKINNGASVCYTTSSPAIDPGRQYVYSYGLDGYVHKHAIADGTEVTTGGWPELVSTKTFDEKSASPLAFATAKSGNTYLYVAAGGYPGDHGDYQGHLTTIDLGSGAQNVFNTLCSDQTVHFVTTPGTPDCSNVQSAIWARAGAGIYEPTLDRLFIATGNGNYAPAMGAWADSLMAVNPDGTGNAGPLDSYTPATFASLQTGDLDLGSTAPLILPAITNSTVAHIGLQGGKDALLRLLDLSNLSGQSKTGQTGGELAQIAIPQGGQMLTAPALWIDGTGTPWIFVATKSGTSAVTVTADATGKLAINTKWKNTNARNSPLVANGVLYLAGSNVVEALDPTTGTSLFSDKTIGALHWQSPVVANGVLYVADSSAHVTAWSLP